MVTLRLTVACLYLCECSHQTLYAGSSIGKEFWESTPIGVQVDIGSRLKDFLGSGVHYGMLVSAYTGQRYVEDNRKRYSEAMS